ncbi:MAG: GreA/GreB family elongation factor [Rhodanobacteraceae bacterium]
MSRAFVKEDVDPPERSGRRRSAAGLPPGATNYITARGAARLQAELTKLRESSDDQERIANLEETFASLQMVDPPEAGSKSVSFGATVTVEDETGKRETYTVLGVEELDFEPHAVSWIAPLGKALLAAELGDRIALPDGRTAKIVRID